MTTQTRTLISLLAGLLAGACALGPAATATAAEDRTLFDFGSGFDLSKAQARDAQISLVKTADGGGALRVAFGRQEQWPGVSFLPEGGPLDLSAWNQVALEVRNVGANAGKISCRIDDDATLKSNKGHVQKTLELAPGESGVLEVPLNRKPLVGKNGETDVFFGMRGNPLTPGFGGGGAVGGAIDTAAVVRVLLFAARPTEDQTFEIRSIRASGAPDALGGAPPLDKLFPFIDEFGQYIHRDWPGKLKSAAEFTERRAAEERDLAAHPGPANWNQYGAWKDGPTLKATGFFHAAKHEGQWRLVDPEGKLFFSHGADCVGAGDATPVTDRDTWFRQLPGRESEFAACFSTAGTREPHYAGRKPLCFDFSQANLMRKHGANWQTDSAALIHRRLRSWGINTIGNWSNADVYLMRKTPYTVSITFPSKPIASSSGHWKTFPDMFDPDFAAKASARMAGEKGKSAGDPWCIGYFVDNELPWGGEFNIAQMALAAPPAQAIKRAFVDDLKAKYGAIDKLNAAWGAKHASWDALLQSVEKPDQDKARADLAAFATRAAEQYFKTCRDAVKAVAPDNLYLGCRFSSSNPAAANAAAKYCDVVSYNLYRAPQQMANWRPDTKADCPLIIGEFHFGALDRGMFHTGLRGVKDQAARAQAYKDYVAVVLKHPQFVGCHWFKYRDEPATGRPADGENYQIGFIDVTDTPYPETIAAVREVGAALYAGAAQ